MIYILTIIHSKHFSILIGFDLHNHLVDLIQDIRHLCTLFMIDGITATSRGISGGKQVIKVANTSNHRRVCLFSQKRNDTLGLAKCTVRVSTCFTSSLLAGVRRSTVATASKKVTMITSTYNLPLSSLI